MPAGTRAVQLPDGDANHPFLKTFGQPARELACECERENDSNLAQALQLINGPTVNEKLRNPNNRIGKLLASKASDTDVLADLYLSTLSRPPTEADAKVALGHITKAFQGVPVSALRPDRPGSKIDKPGGVHDPSGEVGRAGDNVQP
jgi:hypothetical protein